MVVDLCRVNRVPAFGFRLICYSCPGKARDTVEVESPSAFAISADGDRFEFHINNFSLFPDRLGLKIRDLRAPAQSIDVRREGHRLTESPPDVCTPKDNLM